MEIHHDKHHAGYTNNLNKAVEGTEMENKSIEDILAMGADKLPTAVRNNGGGYHNHSLFLEGHVSERRRQAFRRVGASD